MTFSSRENGANGASFGVSLQEMLDPRARSREEAVLGDQWGRSESGQCCRGCCNQGACAALDSARYNMGDKHCLVRINQVHVFKKLFDAHFASQQHAVDLFALLKRSGD
jgi:hypothetical protein